VNGRAGGVVRRIGRWLALATVVMCVGPLASASAATWTVSTTTDPGGAGDCAGAGICSLRQAIADASDGDTVTLPASATPYAVTRGVITVSQAITISGAAANTTTISGSGNGDAGIFLFEADVTVSHASITDGSSISDGGAILVDTGDVELDDVTLSDSTANDGGAVEVTSDGELTIQDSALGPGDEAVVNDAQGGFGGAVDNDGGHLSIGDSTISGDSATGGGVGGGISTEAGGETTLSYDTIAGNSATGSGAIGGDLYADNGGDPPVHIGDSIIADGTAPTGADCNYANGTDDFNSDGDNLTDDTVATGVDACGLQSAENDLLGAPELGALTNNGGETDTELPSAGSPELDVIPDPSAGCPATDQRGISSPQGSDCNIGAVQGSSSSSSASLVITASASPTSVSPDQPVTDTFTVTNDGPDAAVGVTLNDPLPSGVTLVGSSASQGSCSGTTTVSCTIGLVTVGNPQTVSVVIAPTSTGQVSNTASVFETTANPNSANNSATATTTVTSTTTVVSTTTVTPTCTTSMTIDAVEVLATCISEQSGGTYLATGQTSFGDGARMVDAGTQTPATLVLDPSTHQITIAPASGGGAQSGELEAGGVDVATGDLVIATQGLTDPVSGISAAASVTGWSSVDLSLSSWTFSHAGFAPTVYLAPTSAGGGAIVDGQLTVPAWLGDALKFGALAATGLVPGVSGQLAVQANSSGQVSAVDGGLSFQASLLGDSSLKLADAELSYQRAGDDWTGSAALGFASLIKLNVNTVISDGRLDDLGVDFACATSKICGSSSSLPTLGAILDIKDVDLNMINLQGINYTPPPTIGFFRIPAPCFTTRFRSCPAPQPAPQIDGAIIAGLLGDRVITGGNFSYLLDGAFSASGGVGLAPLYGSKFSDPGPLAPGQSAQNAVDNLLHTGYAGVELADATIDYTPPGLLQATGSMDLPPPPFPFQFLKGTISIGIDGAGQFTGEGSLDLVIPGYVPVLGDDSFGGVEALVSDKAAAAQASIPQYCVSVDLGFHTYTECTPKISILVAFDWGTGRVSAYLDGGNLNDYATVPQAVAASAAASNSRTVRVPAGRQLASFTIHSTKGTPDVQLIGPPGPGGRRRLTLATSKRLHNRSGALAWVNRKAHTEGFLVFLPNGGRWLVKRLRGPRVTSVKIMVPRQPLHKTVFPRAVERTSDLPSGTISTDKRLTLHYSVPHAGPGTTVDLWAGTSPHGAGGVIIADGLPPAGSEVWNLSGLASGRYWPYTIVSENGIPESIEYWPRSVEVVNADAPPTPTGVQAALVGGQTYIAWNGVEAAQTYAVTATPAGGGTPVHDAVSATQVADLLALTPGKWSLTVQAVDGADEASLPTAPVQLTVS